MRKREKCQIDGRRNSATWRGKAQTDINERRTRVAVRGMRQLSSSLRRKGTGKTGHG